MASFGTRLLLAWFLSVVIVTLSPFDFGPVVPNQEFWSTASESDQHAPIHMGLNLLLFMPLGSLLNYGGQRRSVRPLSIVLVAGAAAFLIAFALESLQRFLPGHEASLTDLVANTTGGLMGVFADRRWGASQIVQTWEASTALRISELRARTSPAMLISVMTGVTALTLLISAALQSRARLSNWSPDYPLVIGNEHTGDRPWQGRVFFFAVTDAAMPLVSVRRFSAGEPVVMPGSRIAAFDLTGDSPYRDEGSHLPELDWVERPPGSGENGVTLMGRPWLETRRPVPDLANRVRETNAFTLRIECATDDTSQEGPARIASNSASPFLRNFTLGQQGANLVFRLRTPQTGVNGRAETIVPGVFSSDRRRDILVTYDGATLLTAVAHDAEVFRTELTPGSGVALAMSLNVPSTELRKYELGYLAALFLTPGLVIGVLGRTHRERLVFSAVYVLTAAVLLELTLLLVSGRGFDWGNVGVAAGVGTLIFSLLSFALYGVDCESSTINKNGD